MFHSNSFSGSVPTQVGRLDKLDNTLKLESNLLSGAIPTQLGGLGSMTRNLRLFANQLCDDVPSEVAAISGQMINTFMITTGNSIGSVCGWIDDERFPSVGETGVTDIEFTDLDLTVRRFKRSSADDARAHHTQISLDSSARRTKLLRLRLRLPSPPPHKPSSLATRARSQRSSAY